MGGREEAVSGGEGGNWAGETWSGSALGGIRLFSFSFFLFFVIIIRSTIMDKR